MPRHIARFEGLFYASLVVALTAAVADFARLSRSSLAALVLAVDGVVLVLLAVAVWLATRRRQNRARWLLLILWVLELPLQAAGLLVTELGGVEVGRPSLFVSALVPLEWAMQAAALAHAFTGDAKAWFAGHARPARLLDIPMPRSVARFEAAAYSALCLGLVSVALGWTSAPRAAVEVAALAPTGALTWLIVRRRANWARWAFVLVAGAWLGYVALGKLPQSGRLLGALIVVQGGIWVAALGLAFAADAHIWFKPVPGAWRARSKPRLRVRAGRREVAAPGEFDHRGRVEAYVDEMADLGIATYTSAPPLFRLLWAIGLEIPPPLFLAALPLTLIAGSMFAVFWGLGMWLAVWRSSYGLPAWLVLGVAVLAGLLFGACLAAYYRWKARSLSLPSWEDYLPPREWRRPSR